jgi:hypothetical protein
MRDEEGMWLFGSGISLKKVEEHWVGSIVEKKTNHGDTGSQRKP